MCESCQSKLSRTDKGINKLGVIFPSSGIEWGSKDSRLQAGPGACLSRSSASTASEQRTHCRNLDLLPHSPSRCSVRLAISTTWEDEAKLYRCRAVGGR